MNTKRISFMLIDPYMTREEAREISRDPSKFDEVMRRIKLRKEIPIRKEEKQELRPQ